MLLLFLSIRLPTFVTYASLKCLGCIYLYAIAISSFAIVATRSA